MGNRRSILTSKRGLFPGYSVYNLLHPPLFAVLRLNIFKKTNIVLWIYEVESNLKNFHVRSWAAVPPSGFPTHRWPFFFLSPLTFVLFLDFSVAQTRNESNGTWTNFSTFNRIFPVKYQTDERYLSFAGLAAGFAVTGEMNRLWDLGSTVTNWANLHTHAALFISNGQMTANENALYKKPREIHHVPYLGSENHLNQRKPKSFFISHLHQFSYSLNTKKKTNAD